MSVELRPARNGDLGAAKTALEDAGLPTAGLESYGSLGLLRSLVVSSDAPAAIRNTAEFAGLCPGSAVLMRKVL